VAAQALPHVRRDGDELWRSSDVCAAAVAAEAPPP